MRRLGIVRRYGILSRMEARNSGLPIACAEMTEAHSPLHNTPIALFTYNRPEHTRRALTSLSRCTRLEECDLYIYCDSPRRPEHSAAVHASRSVVRDWAARRDARVIERSHNLGLARSVVTGVTELCTRYGRVIVLEDDLIVSPDFLDYMLQALERYRDESRVYQVSGFLFAPGCPSQPDAFFLPLTTTWGWATWDRAWRVFDWHVEDACKRLANPAFRWRFDLDGSYPYSRMLEQQLKGQIDSWGILWWYTVFNLGGLVLYPRQSLVRNLGVDHSGTHDGGRGMTGHGPQDVAHVRLSKPLVFPPQVEADERAFDRVKVFLKVSQKRTAYVRVVSLIQRVRKMLEKPLKTR